MADRVSLKIHIIIAISAVSIFRPLKSGFGFGETIFFLENHPSVIVPTNLAPSAAGPKRTKQDLITSKGYQVGFFWGWGGAAGQTACPNINQ